MAEARALGLAECVRGMPHASLHQRAACQADEPRIPAVLLTLRVAKWRSQVAVATRQLPPDGGAGSTQHSASASSLARRPVGRAILLAAHERTVLGIVVQPREWFPSNATILRAKHALGRVCPRTRRRARFRDRALARSNDDAGGERDDCPSGGFGQNRHIAMENAPNFGVVGSGVLELADVNGDGLADLVGTKGKIRIELGCTTVEIPK